MRVLVTGAAGQLGSDLVKRLRETQIETIGADLEDFDITDDKATYNFVGHCRPDMVVHCAAYTKVDQAEEEPDLCGRINVEGTKNLAAACRESGSGLCYISTDYVFDGKTEFPYETDDAPNPVSVYGRSKYQGEQLTVALVPNHYILRTSWVFGKNGHNFVKTMLRLGENNKSLRIVSDQISSPTYTVDLACLITDLIRTGKHGTYHGTNSGFCSWADFAEEIFRQMNWDVAIERIRSSDYPTKAIRPKDSRLSKHSLVQAGLLPLPDWQDGLVRFLKEIKAI